MKTKKTAPRKPSRGRKQSMLWWRPLFWTCQVNGARIAQTWPDEDSQAASELQLFADHFSLADEPCGVIYTTHAVDEGGDE